MAAAVSTKAPVGTRLVETQTDTWKQLAVGQFLRQVNWKNQPEVAESPAEVKAIPVTELNYQLSVGQFFAAIPWKGEAVELSEDSEPEPQLPEIEGEDLAGTTNTLPLELPDLDEFADNAAGSGENLTLDDFFDAFSDF